MHLVGKVVAGISKTKNFRITTVDVRKCINSILRVKKIENLFFIVISLYFVLRYVSSNHLTMCKVFRILKAIANIKRLTPLHNFVDKMKTVDTPST